MVVACTVVREQAGASKSERSQVMKHGNKFIAEWLVPYSEATRSDVSPVSGCLE